LLEVISQKGPAFVQRWFSDKGRWPHPQWFSRYLTVYGLPNFFT